MPNTPPAELEKLERQRDSLRRHRSTPEGRHKHREASRRYTWKARGIDITPERYDELLASQNGRCAICREPPISRRLSVDHDHATNEIRGLLCHKCNRALGSLASISLLVRAIFYLKKFPC